MKKYLIKNNSQKVLLLSLIVFCMSYFLYLIFQIEFPLNLSGFVLAIFIPGFAIKTIFYPKENLVNNMLISPVFTIFIFIPLIYIIFNFFGLKIEFSDLFWSVFIISTVSFIFNYKNNNFEKINLVDNKFIFFGIIMFLLVHLATTSVYRFIPEVDGYTYIGQITKIIQTGVNNITLRPVFHFFVSYVSLISKISPYLLFKYYLILIQISGIYYYYKIIKLSKIKSSYIIYLSLLALVSVPVINLEIDYIRPNIFFIFGFIPFVYYLARGIDNNKSYLFLSTIISVTGIMYHEFFVILLLVNFIFILSFLYNKFDNYKRLLFFVGLAMLSLIALINVKKIPVVSYLLMLVRNVVDLIMNGLQWKWWFLSSYTNMDNTYLGWNGIEDVSKYYAYSLSPLLIIVLIASILLLFRQIKQNKQLLVIEKMSYLIMFIGLAFTELLPRINFKTLPDRFWPMVVLSSLALLPFVLSKIKLFSLRFFIILSLMLIFIGIGGSIYIAKMKGGYTTEKEYLATQWILNNTDADSVFISQIGNGVMLDYFANRKMIVPASSFFFDNNLIRTEQIPFKSTSILETVQDLYLKSLVDPREDNLFLLTDNIKRYHQEIEIEKVKNNFIDSKYVLPKYNDLYVLYSMDKFNSYYGRRKWWRDINFYGANLSNFLKGYELVYNDDNIVYIWRKK